MKILFFDLETTGLGYDKAGIVELAAILMEMDDQNNLKTLDKIDLHICPRPNKFIDQESLKINGLTEEIINSYQDDASAFEQFVNFLNKHINQFDKMDKMLLAGYNNNHFDNDFLRYWFKDNNNNFFGSYFWSGSIDLFADVSRYYLHYRPAFKNFKLGTVAKTMGINVNTDSLHNGLYDIILTIKMFKFLLNEPLIKPFDENIAIEMFQNRNN